MFATVNSANAPAGKMATAESMIASYSKAAAMVAPGTEGIRMPTIPTMAPMAAPVIAIPFMMVRPAVDSSVSITIGRISPATVRWVTVGRTVTIGRAITSTVVSTRYFKASRQTQPDHNECSKN
jgi:hypothetical protein